MLPSTVPLLCTTATANDRVVADIVDQLGADLEVVRGPLDRSSLELGVVDLPDRAHRLAWLAHVLPRLDGSGIVYCLTIDDTVRVADWLRSRGIDAVAYSGDTDASDRLDVEEALLSNRVKAVVATSALGMGFDKPDLAFVVHFQSPGSPIAYYQQVGRAGRAVDEAVAVLLRGCEDTDIQDHFIRTAFPPRAQAEEVVRLLSANGVLSLSGIEREVNVRRGRLEAMLKVLEVEGAVERSSNGWLRTAQPWTYDTERVERVTALRRTEQAAMNEYAATSGCRMTFLLGQLDDRTASACGRCDTCTGRPFGVDLPPQIVADAIAYLRSAALHIEPRRQWPPGGEPRGRIAADHLLMTGRALARIGDGGWGNHVRRPFPDEVVAAAVELVRAWAPPVGWVACVPGASDLAARMAEALGLPFRDVVRRVRTGRPQREMENSAQQLRNVLGAFAVDAQVAADDVLLVDDTVDSRWTLTTVGIALREAGSGPVHPFVLAKAAGS